MFYEFSFSLSRKGGTVTGAHGLPDASPRGGSRVPAARGAEAVPAAAGSALDLCQTRCACAEASVFSLRTVFAFAEFVFS